MGLLDGSDGWVYLLGLETMGNTAGVEVMKEGEVEKCDI